MQILAYGLNLPRAPTKGVKRERETEREREGEKERERERNRERARPIGRKRPRFFFYQSSKRKI